MMPLRLASLLGAEKFFAGVEGMIFGLCVSRFRERSASLCLLAGWVLAGAPGGDAPVSAQVAAPAPNCPVQVLHFSPDGVSIRIHNVSGKTIVGITYEVALADATEHWRWLHWDFDYNRALREFNWNKQIKPDATKTLSWIYSNLDFTHGGGGDFVLTSVLFGDGTSWEETPNGASCSTFWLNNHKKAFVRPVVLPMRD